LKWFYSYSYVFSFCMVFNIFVFMKWFYSLIFLCAYVKMVFVLFMLKWLVARFKY
jgi:hypothetical protein